MMGQALDVQLQEPHYQNGELTTDKGGTVTGKDLYLQAQNIRYIRRDEKGTFIHRVEASGDLYFRFKNRTYSGDRVDMDLESGVTVIQNGCTQV